jgi:uncharacterized protein (TIGR01619 family)
LRETTLGDAVDSAWDVYTTQVEDKPAFVLVDSGLARYAPLKTHPDLVTCRIPINSFHENGFPSKEEFKIIYSFEDKLTPIAKSPNDIYAGRLGFDKWVGFFFYTAASPDLIRKFETSAELKAITPFFCEAQTDAQWSTYFVALYPSPQARNRIENSKVRQNLLKEGDDGTTARKIDHFAFFKDANARNSFRQRIERDGYSIEEEATLPDNRGLWSVRFSKSQKPAELDPITWELEMLALELYGHYDGWGCLTVYFKH